MQSIRLAGAGPGDDGFKMIAAHDSNILQRIEAGPQDIGALLLQYGEYEDLFAIENVAPLLAIGPHAQLGEPASVPKQSPAQPFERRTDLLLQARDLVYSWLT